MALQSYTAQDLYELITKKNADFLLLDVRNASEFARFQIEGPRTFDMTNVPYMEFVELEDQSVAKVPTGKPVHIVCAKEGSAKCVGEILDQAKSFGDVRYLEGGIKTWGNMLVPIRVSDLAGDKEYELYQFLRPGKASCSYGLVYKGEMMLFDPSRNVDLYTAFAREKGVKMVRTFETHLQADYIAGSHHTAQTSGATFTAPPDDFKDAVFQYSASVDGDTFACGGGPEVKVIHTPGHTPGSTCYFIDDSFLITGDTVFVQSVGRPDLGGQAEAWAQLLYATLQERIAPLPGAVVALPGHFADWGEASADSYVVAATMGEVREHNKDIYNIAREADFIQFIKENMREQPPEYAVIRQVNAGLVEKNEDEQEILDLGKNECAASTGK